MYAMVAMATFQAGVKRSYHEMRSHDVVTNVNAAEMIGAAGDGFLSREGSPSLLSNSKGPDAGVLTPRSRKASFKPDASLLLIGVRGVGKSSLGFLAASAYSRRLIESDKAFSEATGSTRSQYRKAKGPSEYHKKHCDILTALLARYNQNSVIVCSLADLEHDGARLIQDFAQAHPVIYVTRDVTGMQKYIQIWSEERIQDLIRASEPLLRDCSNFEFFNVTETVDSDNSSHSVSDIRTSSGPFLTLKRTEHDFLKLVRNILGDHARSRSHQSAYPLSQISVEDLEFTSAVLLSVEDLLLDRLDLDEAQIGVDAILLDVFTHLDQLDNWRSSRHANFGRISEAFALLRRSTILPIALVTSTGESSANKAQITVLELLDYCLRLGPEYCVFDLQLKLPQLQNLILAKGRTKAIGDFALPPESRKDNDYLEVYRKAEGLGCDLVRFTMPFRSLADNFAVETMKQKLTSLHDRGKPKVIAYCTGKPGRTSMCLNQILTPVRPWNGSETPNTRNTSRLITAKDRNAALFATFVHEPMQFFIYGANVSFSLSPAMHNAAYEACGMSHTYRTHSASNLDEFANLIRRENAGGAAIVQPFKTKAIAMMDVLSPQAKAIGALNTVIPLRDESAVATAVGNHGIFRERNRTGPVKALYGDNTDWIGIRACIRRGLSPANTVRPHSTGLVCGAGGMARAAIYAMISLGVQNIIVCNRTKGNAEELAKHYNNLIQTNGILELSPANAATTCVTALDSFDCQWPSSMRHPTMIVSCIPTQTVDGAPTNFTLPKDWLSSRTGGVVVELAYMPIVTPLVRQVRSESRKGWILMDGLDMLPEQAYAQFELFTGRRAPRSLMRREIFKHYSEDEYPPHGALNTDSP